MTKYTPGPWSAQCDRHSARNRMALVITTASSASKRVQAIDCTGSAESYGGDCANARLIAVAPELLKALEMLLQDYQCALSSSRQITNIVEDARAAIAKATGEQRSE